MDRRKEVFINGRYLTQRMTGVQRYATEIVSSLDRILQDQDSSDEPTVTLLVPPGNFQLPVLNNIRLVQGGKLSGHLWEQIDLPRLAHGGVLFSPCGPSPLFHPRQVTTLHDASVFSAPDGYSFLYRNWTRFLYRWSGAHARAILTDSQYSKRSLIKYCRSISLDKIHVIYPGCDHVLHCNADPSLLEDISKTVERDYVLCVGSRQANKNIAVVASISGWLEEKGISVIVAGGGSKAVFRTDEGDESGLTKTGYVTDAQLRAFYENARCFIFPSLEEGFGIPPLEAMRCMCPVISSSSASMPEVCGDGAIYFDPHDKEELKGALDTVLTETSLVEKLKKRGTLQAEKYTWERTALAIWSHLRREDGISN